MSRLSLSIWGNNIIINPPNLMLFFGNITPLNQKKFLGLHSWIFECADGKLCAGDRGG